MFRAACDLLGPLQGDAKTEVKPNAVRRSSFSPSFPELHLPSIMNPEDDRDEPISPFVKYESDGYVWPDLYSEIDEMMECCVLLYPLVDLRRLARQNELTGHKILNLPITLEVAMKAVEKYKQKLLDTFTDEVSIKTLAAAKQRAETHLSPTTIVAIDDEFEKEELVYSVQVNGLRKRVTVCFRGSKTKTDWANNFEVYFKEISNPLKEHASQEETVRVHNGFHNYLFEPNERGVKGPDGELLSQYQEILQEHVLPVLRQHPDYKLYVTGHR